jgi:TfuA protein
MRFYNRNVYVFGGPSLELIPKELINKVKCFPPIKSGDLDILYSLPPSICIIIDGVFSGKRAVTIFECRELLEKGWVVIGASSMGALRAADLWSYGMIGIGDVYNMFRIGVCRSDADVAVVYNILEDFLCEEITISMVHVRSVLHYLSTKGSIDKAKARLLICKARQISWEERMPSVLFDEWGKFLGQEKLINKIKRHFNQPRLHPKKVDAVNAMHLALSQQWCSRF